MGSPGQRAAIDLKDARRGNDSCPPRGRLSALWAGLCALLVLWVTPTGDAQAQTVPARRVAFVIGNARYENEAPLTNPHNDAALIARVLKNDLKFDEVVERRDLKRGELFDLKTDIQRRARGADAVVVYYSGHGMRGPGGNYLIPVDAHITEEDHVRRDGINVADIVDALQAVAPRVALLVLDACRDSPYARRTRSTSKGLARMNNISGGNLLVAYATSEGNTADDGAPGNSPYARALAQQLADTSKSVLAQFDGVRRSVLAATQNKQNPTREGDLEVDVHLVSPFGRTNAGEQARLEDESWALCRGASTMGPCEEYLKLWNRGRYAGLARTKLKELQELEQRGIQPVASVRDGQVIRDCSECPELVVLPAGRFRMGSPAGEVGRFDWEGPAHEVRIGYRLALGRTEVTRGQFAKFVQTSGYRTDAERNAGGSTGCQIVNEYIAGRSWRDPGFEQTDEHPVVCVSWNDAQAYVKWLNEKAPGKGYRLTSEAEWEYAARAGTTTIWYWGDDPNQACSHANGLDETFMAKVHDAAACTDGAAYTAPVGSYRPNAFGLSDMLGNAWEWTQDVWHDNYEGAPTDGAAWSNIGDQASRVLRGGAWSFQPTFLRSATRNIIGQDHRHFDTGFRIARTF